MKNLNFLSKAFVAIVAMLSIGLSALAHDFEVNGIYYNYLDKTAKTIEVTYKGDYSSEYSNEYTGAVTIPSSVTYSGTTYSVTEIGYYAFEYCYGLTEVNITDLSAWCKIDFGDYYANPLYYAKKLKLNGTVITNLVIPNDITQIKKYAFYGCTSLTSVTIPNSVTEIGYGAFLVYSGLTEVNISDLSAWCKIDFGNSGSNPLYQANKLKLNGVEITNLVIPNDITQIKDYAFYGCTGLTSVTIPNSVTSIGDGAFSECSGLTSVTIPNSVTSIGDGAFKGCSGLTSVTIGNSVTEIGDDAFYDCYLKSVTSYCMTPPRCYHDAFGGSYSAILKVPEGTKDLYANATVWEDFYNIQEIAGVEDVLIDNVVVKIAVENGNISINGIENPHIEIYNINGKCIYSGNDTTIPVSDTGVYILRINGKSYKIVNK